MALSLTAPFHIISTNKYRKGTPQTGILEPKKEIVDANGRTVFVVYDTLSDAEIEDIVIRLNESFQRESILLNDRESY